MVVDEVGVEVQRFSKRWKWKEAKRCRRGRGRVLMGRQQLGAGAGSTRGLIVALA